jgi:hypothetical protein
MPSLKVAIFCLVIFVAACGGSKILTVSLNDYPLTKIPVGNLEEIDGVLLKNKIKKCGLKDHKDSNGSIGSYAYQVNISKSGEYIIDCNFGLVDSIFNAKIYLIDVDGGELKGPYNKVERLAN